MNRFLHKSIVFCALSTLFWVGAIEGQERLHAYLTTRIALEKTRLHTTEALMDTRKHSEAFLQQNQNTLSPSERDSLLAPVDRVTISHLLTSLAQSADFSQARFDLSAEENADDILPHLKRSTLTIEAMAPTDGTIQNFAEKLHKRLPGRLDWQALSLHREETSSPSAPSLKLSAKLVWFTNGAGLSGGSDRKDAP